MERTERARTNKSHKMDKCLQVFRKYVLVPLLLLLSCSPGNVLPIRGAKGLASLIMPLR